MSNNPIDCDAWVTDDCADAKEFRENAIISDVVDAFWNAKISTDEEGETYPNQCATVHLLPVAYTLCELAKSNNWEYCEPCSEVGVEW